MSTMSKISDTIRKVRHNFCTVVVVAAGNSTRMGEDKLFMPLGDKCVLAQTLLALNASAAVDELIVVTRADKLQTVGEIRARYGIEKLTRVVIGGQTRTESALAGACEASRHAKIICIHDGARPFVTENVIADAVHNAVLNLAAAPALPIKDTLKTAVDGVVTATPDRSAFYAVQTPQAFQADIIKAALSRAVACGISYSDDCAAVEAMGVPVHLSRGSEENIKLTTRDDLLFAEMILKKREGAEA